MLARGMTRQRFQGRTVKYIMPSSLHFQTISLTGQITIATLRSAFQSACPCSRESSIHVPWKRWTKSIPGRPDSTALTVSQWSLLRLGSVHMQSMVTTYTRLTASIRLSQTDRCPSPLAVIHTHSPPLRQQDLPLRMHAYSMNPWTTTTTSRARL